MAAWAYECKPCEGGATWWVARDTVDAMATDVSILQLKIGGDWRCAVVDRDHAVAVEASLLRQAVAASAPECPGCAQAPVAEPAAAADAAAATGATLQAAAIQLQGVRMLVVLVGMDLLASPGEADMLAADLGARFGAVDIVLMAQDDSGAPQFHGAAANVDLLADVPIDKMPWRAYPLS
ncbi:MAG: hypothetical protein Q8N44_08325 [Rubrivivax sp.]|nr:hypothetical protein [Rubrivivax sp.]MDP3083681.1 hypothetical protein [Rubrivivax sp.]